MDLKILIWSIRPTIGDIHKHTHTFYELLLQVLCYRRLLRVSLTVRRSNQSIVQDINIHWNHWCWSRSSNTLATSWEEPTHWKRPWCWERLGAGGEGGNRGQDGRMASLTQWTWVWANSGRYWKDREAWCAAIHRVAKSCTRLSERKQHPTNNIALKSTKQSYLKIKETTKRWK